MSDEGGNVVAAPPGSPGSPGSPGAVPERDAQPPPETAGAPPAPPAAPPPGRTSRTSNGTVLIPGAAARTSAASAPATEPLSSEPPRTSRGTLLMPAGPQRAARRSRTTIMEVSQVAQRLSLLRNAGSDEPSPTRQIAISFAVSVTVVTLGTMMFSDGPWRLVLGVLAGTSGTTLAVWLTLRSLPRLAKRLGQRELPGTPLLWVGGLIALAMAATAGLTYGVSEATRPLARPSGPIEPAAPPEPTLQPAEPARSARADETLKRGAHVMLDDGLLYVPAAFHSEDGRFDVVIHYHGNPEIVERSIDLAGLNAIAHIINLGDGSGRYSEPLRNPQAFDTALERIEQRVEKLGLRSARIRRVALSSWSAGFGAVYHILTSRSRLDRVDALLMMDSLHASFAPASETKLTDLSLRPFVQFGRRATAGEKLMVLTHSAIETYGYPDTTRSADGLLERLGLTRQPVSPETASPPPVTVDAIVKTFPPDERNWMRVTSVTEEGSLVVLGCRGKGKGDHIAHLAQISVAVLPRLVQRWKPSGGSE